MHPCFCKRNPGSKSDILFLVGLKLTKRSSQTLSGMTTHCQQPAVFDLRLTDGGHRLHWQMLAEGSQEAVCSQQFDRSVTLELWPFSNTLVHHLRCFFCNTGGCGKLAFWSQGCLRCIRIKIGIHIAKFLLISQPWLFLESSLGKPDTQQASCVAYVIGAAPSKHSMVQIVQKSPNLSQRNQQNPLATVKFTPLRHKHGAQCHVEQKLVLFWKQPFLQERALFHRRNGLHDDLRNI